MYAREYRSTRPHKAIFFHLSCLTLICSAQVYAPLSGMDGRAEYNRTGIGLPDFIYA